MAPSGERLWRKGSHGVFAGKTVWSMPERFEIYIVYKRRYIHTLSFLFSKRQRITLRLLYAMGRPSVVCLSVVCLWRWCTLLRRLNFSAIFFHHTIAQGLYFSGAKNRWWGTPLFPWNLRSKWPTPFQTAKFRQISAHSASTVIASEKSSISTYIGSRPRAFQRAIDEPCTLPLSPPKVGTKTRYRCLCQ